MGRVRICARCHHQGVYQDRRGPVVAALECQGCGSVTRQRPIAQDWHALDRSWALPDEDSEPSSPGAVVERADQGHHHEDNQDELVDAGEQRTHSPAAVSVEVGDDATEGPWCPVCGEAVQEESVGEETAWFCGPCDRLWSDDRVDHPGVIDESTEHDDDEQEPVAPADATVTPEPADGPLDEWMEGPHT